MEQKTGNKTGKTNVDNTYAIEGTYRGKVSFDFLPALNYSLIQAQIKTCHCSVTNDTDADWRMAVLSLEGDKIEPVKSVIDAIPAHTTVNDSRLRLTPDVSELLQLTEGYTTQFTLRLSVADAPVFEKTFSVNIMAFDQWAGMAVHPGMISAFVTPNASSIPRVVKSAAEVLEKLTGSNAMNDYQTLDPNRVRAMVAAIYEALRAEKIIYSTVPASFEKCGQRVRLADKVLIDKLGTCLDTTALMASCMEFVGIHPLIVFFRGHAFVGAWLVDQMYGKAVGDDPTFLSKSAADGVSDIVLVETTGMTGDMRFEDAVKAAMSKLSGDMDEFELFVDVARCRCEGIRPLPLKYQNDGSVVIDEETKDVAAPKVKEVKSYDLSNAGTQHELTRREIWERKLLDISMRNNLLNMTLGSRVVPLLTYDLPTLEDNIQSGTNYIIVPCPLPGIPAPGKGQIYNSASVRPQAESIVKAELAGKHICSYLTETELKNALTTIARNAKSSLEETGANSLFLALGVLKFYETDQSQLARYAPLLLLPINIVRKNGLQGYEIRTREEDIFFNTTLIEMLKQTYDIQIPALSPLPEDDHGVDVQLIFTIVRDAIRNRARWDVMEEALIGMFSFSKYVMWNDIHSNPEELAANKILRSLMEGHCVWDVTEEMTDVRRLDAEAKPGDFIVPVDVDSSQLEAVIDSGKGKTFILYGPPGTGKSQTITNMIANALYQNKRVLFVAEKKAALDVVQNRLAKIGLAPFCLELHSNKVTKQHFLKQMEETLKVVHAIKNAKYENASEELFAKRRELLDYVEALHGVRECGMSLYDCINGNAELAAEVIALDEAMLDSLTKDKIDSFTQKLKDIDLILSLSGHPMGHPLHGLYPRNNDFDEDAVKALLKTYAETLRSFEAMGCQSYADILKLRDEWREVSGKWFLPRIFAQKAFVKRMQSGNPAASADQIKALFATLEDTEARLQKDMLFSHRDGQKASDYVSLWLDNAEGLLQWSRWAAFRSELVNAGMQCIVDYIETHHAAGEPLSQSFRKSCYKHLADRIMRKDKTMRMFNGMIHDDIIRKYKAFTRKFQELSKRELQRVLAERIPDPSILEIKASELGKLKTRIKSGGRSISIRNMIDEIPTLMPKLAPCMLMSPMTVAQFTNIKDKFDLVLFDEASQMPTSEAVGAIARSRGLIVVGDPKQMPPTSFFSSHQTNDDAEIDDMENILDDCERFSFPSHRLSWHYRSKHESLIAFSNSQYYDGNLFTFPSVDDKASKVVFVPINGTYDRSRTRCNRAEAEAIVKEVARRLSDPELSKRSIGIVSFSKVQQQLIEKLLEEYFDAHAELRQKAEECEEPLFIKNLENVQGDERDVILFSVGYGPDKNGQVSMNFGPLNNQGGERRLNVAVSRARYEMMVFSSLKASHIDLNRTSALGVEGLKRFLEYAENSTLGISSQQLHTKRNEAIVHNIAEALRSRGYACDINVGRSKFMIDIAVIDKKQPDKYALGILLDGYPYYDTKTMRDREICQPSVLTMLGWHVMRVWSAEWHGKADEVIDKIVNAIENGPAPEPTPAPAPAPAPEPVAPAPAAPIAAAAPKRDIKDIFPSEIKLDILSVLKQQGAIPREALILPIAQMLGFARTGSNINNAINSAINTLIREGKVAETNGSLHLPNS
ncbi:MAG: DUF4011 domain-containing protein [Muribaculaceae bacterium]|nr:DUF4011 domain-containing protein [Muribaculaceae bacterium]